MKPQVLSERETLELLHQGKSIGRLGDGELALIRGRGIKSQDYDRRLAGIMRQALRDSFRGGFVCGIVPNDGRSPNKTHVSWCWKDPWLYSAKKYGSAYITRPDCQPDINEPAYWQRVEDLWRDQDVMLVRGSTKSLTKERLGTAHRVHEIIAERRNAFAQYDELLSHLHDEAAGRRILLCLGPTATALAYELAQRGHHALDIGHVGMFLRRYRSLEAEMVAA